MVTLMTQSYFEECLKSKIPEPQPGGINAHTLFNLKGVGENQVPLSRYFTCDITIGGMVVPDIGVLVKADNFNNFKRGQNKSTCNNWLQCFQTRSQKIYPRLQGNCARVIRVPKGNRPLILLLCRTLLLFRTRSQNSDSKFSGGRGQWQKRGGGSSRGDLPCWR